MANPNSVAGKAGRRQSDRLLRLAKANYTASDIAHIEGLSLDDAKSRLTKLIKEHGLTGRRKSLEQPYGIDSDSRLFRSRVADLLRRVVSTVEGQGGHKIDVARMLGMFPVEITKAMETNAVYDIKLSTLQRLARVVGVHFEDFMKDLSAGHYRVVERNYNGEPTKLEPNLGRLATAGLGADNRISKAILDYYQAFSREPDGDVDARSRRDRLGRSVADDVFRSGEGEDTPVHQPIRDAAKG